nr:alpha/beta hydrolase [Rhizobium sp. Q54]
MKETTVQKILTSHGVIAVEMTRSTGPDVVLIHGNSSCRDVFRLQLGSDLGKTYRLISFDLPGHGQSSDAFDKTRTYPLPGLADATVELMEKLNIEQPVLLGWSLGGHVAIEVASRGINLRGLFLTGTPPVGADISQGFRGSLLNGVASSGPFTRQQAAKFALNVFGSASAPEFEEVALRTDGAFRSVLFSAIRVDEKSDQRAVVGSTVVPTAVVNGADDPVVNLHYVDSVRYSNLWKGVCFRVAESGHAPFLQNAQEFNSLLRQFLQDI